MAHNNKAYTFPIGNQSGGNSDTNFEKQMSPSWVLTFVRFFYRDLLRTPGSVPTQVVNNDPLIVQNDCIQLEISIVKNNLTPSLKAVLVMTDIDYETAVNPGDFVLANILNWDNGTVLSNSPEQGFTTHEMSADVLVTRIKNGQPINRLQDGFKGLFRIQSVRKTIQVNPGNGVKVVRFEITAFAFTEFDNALYFNPNLVNKNVQNNFALFVGDTQKKWANLNNFAGVPFVQELIANLIRIFLGEGTSTNVTNGATPVLKFSFNNQYIIPGLVGKLMGLTNYLSHGNISASDIYTYLFGIQSYNAHATSPTTGLNPVGPKITTSNPTGLTEKYPRFFYTQTSCAGNSTLKPDYWNNVKLWSVLNEYTNSPLNELYTCFRLSPNNTVLPTVVFRQTPFTNDDFVGQKFGILDNGSASTISVTKFTTIPRWKVSPYYVFSLNIGKEESARKNFVQYFAKSLFTKNGIDLSAETALQNYCFDGEDAQRSGLKPYIVSVQFSDLPNQAIDFAQQWARILSDCLFGGQLKLNGSMECIGIYEPIAVGDNLEFDNVLYHIEGIVHKCSIGQEGIKSFRTMITISNGISLSTSDAGLKYAQMNNENAYSERAVDYKNENILPGVSESQDTVNRNHNIDQVPAGNLSFPQPDDEN
jgi:hypothetical protein